MKQVVLLILICAGAQLDANGQARADLYNCQGCEAIYEHAFDDLTHHTVITEDGEPLMITGTVYQSDGKTPAADVVIYIHHTDKNGVYPKRGNEKGWARQHGYMRGWVKTDSEGQYSFLTIKPAPYPNLGEPAHIHLTLKEPDLKEYWIDNIVFGGEVLVDEKFKKSRQNRGGSGVISLTKNKKGMWLGNRDIVLEEHP